MAPAPQTGAPWGTLLDLQTGRLIRGRTRALVKREVAVGRSSSCDVVVASKNNLMSRVHFKLARADRGGATLTDTSSIGTLVGAVRCSGAAFQLPQGATSEIEIPDGDEGEDSKFFVFTPGSSGSRTSDISVPTDSAFYITRTELGKGNFSVVRLGINIATSERVAVKVLDKRATGLNADSMNEVAIAQEIAILKSCNHPNIVKFYDVETNKRYICIYLQLVRGGSMLERLESGPYSGAESAFLFYQLLQGIAYLHARNICHRDIKIENVLLESCGNMTRVLLSDFGMARAIGGGKAMTTRCGTLAYCSPELLRDGRYDKATDIWSAGVVLYVMLTSTLPFYSADDAEVAKKIRAAGYDSSLLDREDIGSDAKAMVQYLLDPNRNQRPTASQSLSHHWLQTRRPILEKLYDKLLRKSNWTPSSPESEGTVMPLAPATPGPGKQATPRTVRTLGQASQVSVGVIPATPCPQAQEGATTAKRPREPQTTYGTTRSAKVARLKALRR